MTRTTKVARLTAYDGEPQAREPELTRAGSGTPWTRSAASPSRCSPPPRML
nr:hypothetical protein [Streptomyces thermolilacinus]